MSKGLSALVKIITALCVLFAFFCISTVIFLKTPLIPAHKTIDYVLKPGASIRTLADDFHAMGLLISPYPLIGLAYCQGVTKHLKAGEYIFPAGATPTQVLKQIAAGKVFHRNFVLVEGWNFKEVMAALDRNPFLTHKLTGLNPKEIAIQLDLPFMSPEGVLFPATYPYVKGTTDIALLQKAAQKMSKNLNQEWSKRSSGVTYQTAYQALIAASLIEKETAQSFERPLIANVLLRRLQINMPLQIDATVIYGLGSHTGRITHADLTKYTAYNTYLNKGLPPTPIAMPSLASIHAALHPVAGPWLYYVAKGDGTHQFSQTLAAQNDAVKKYQMDILLPQVGRKLNYKTHAHLWYLSPFLQNLFL